MRAVRLQTTLRGPCSITGRGYWSGKVNTLTFLPAPANTGIRFYRLDLMDQLGALAVAENCHGLSLRTCLVTDQLRLEMIEHVMAALSGLQVDNAWVHCTAAEMPGMDGSSFAIASALSNVGTIELNQIRAQLRVDRMIRVGNDQAWLTIEPSDQFAVEYRLDYGATSPIGRCTFAAMVNPETFLHEIAPARTFITRNEADALNQKGIATHVTDRDLIVFDDHGPVNTSLRFPNEVARHKALDVIGDLSVVGADVLGKVTCSRSGHQLNGQLAFQLRQIYLQQQPNCQPAPGMIRAA